MQNPESSSHNHLAGMAELPPGAKIQVGIPSEEPTEALQVLIEHFKTRPTVQRALIGLLQLITDPPSSSFTYTIGIKCALDSQQEIEQDMAQSLLSKYRVSSGRWPISFFRPEVPYFSPESRIFYRTEPSSTARPSLWKRLFGSLQSQ